MKPILYLALGALTALLVGGASAQDAKIDYDNTAAAIEQESCYPYVVTSLKAATDPAKRADQDFNLKAADAYLRLAGLGATC